MDDFTENVLDEAIEPFRSKPKDLMAKYFADNMMESTWQSSNFFWHPVHESDEFKIYCSAEHQKNAKEILEIFRNSPNMIVFWVNFGDKWKVYHNVNKVCPTKYSLLTTELMNNVTM